MMMKTWERMIDRLETWMMFVGFLTAIAEIPQIIKLAKRKTSADISLLAWFVIYFGQCSWLSYGLVKGSISLVACNALNILFSVVVMVLCVVYSEEYKKKRLKKM